MANKVNNSFIPKPPSIAHDTFQTKKSVDVTGIVAVVIFFVALILAGAVFLYQRSLISNVEQLAVSLEEAERSIDKFAVQELKEFDQQLVSANSKLNAHTAFTQLFDYLEANTLTNVRFSSFALSAEDPRRIMLELTGEAKSFETVALQSDQFNDSGFFEEVVISDVNTGDSGGVNFSVRGIITPSLVSYENTVSGSTISAGDPIEE